MRLSVKSSMLLYSTSTRRKWMYFFKWMILQHVSAWVDIKRVYSLIASMAAGINIGLVNYTLFQQFSFLLCFYTQSNVLIALTTIQFQIFCAWHFSCLFLIHHFSFSMFLYTMQHVTRNKSRRGACCKWQ